MSTDASGLSVVVSEVGRRLLADWRGKGLDLSLGDGDKIVPSRRLTDAEMAQMREVVVSTDKRKVTARDAIFEALRQEWLAATVYTQDLSLTCAAHPDREVYRYSSTGVAECEECALFGPEESVQSPLPMLDTTAPEKGPETPLSGAHGYAERGL